MHTLDNKQVKNKTIIGLKYCKAVKNSVCEHC